MRQLLCKLQKPLKLRDIFSQYCCLSLSTVTLRVTEAREQTYRQNFILDKKLNSVVYFVGKRKMRNCWLWLSVKNSWCYMRFSLSFIFCVDICLLKDIEMSYEVVSIPVHNRSENISRSVGNFSMH